MQTTFRALAVEQTSEERCAVLLSMSRTEYEVLEEWARRFRIGPLKHMDDEVRESFHAPDCLAAMVGFAFFNIAVQPTLLMEFLNSGKVSVEERGNE